MAFLNDKRNLGGRDFITSQMINHKATLLNIKSSIKIVPPKDHVDKFKEKKSSSKSKNKFRFFIKPKICNGESNL